MILFTVITQVIVLVVAPSISMHRNKVKCLMPLVQRLEWRRAHNLKLIGLTSFKFVETRRKCLNWLVCLGGKCVNFARYTFVHSHRIDNTVMCDSFNSKGFTKVSEWIHFAIVKLISMELAAAAAASNFSECMRNLFGLVFKHWWNLYFVCAARIKRLH